MDKKFVVIAVVLFSIFVVMFLAAPVGAASLNDEPIVNFEVESNPELVGSYNAFRCNQYDCWREWGTYTALEVFNPFVSKWVGLGGLYFKGSFSSSGPRITFRAAPGYHWEHYDESFFDREHYVLMKD